MLRAFATTSRQGCFWSFFQNNVGISSPNAKSTDSRSAGSFACGPFRQLSVDVERTVCKIYVRIRLFIVQAGRQQLVFQCQDCFEQARYTCCCIEMSYICLYRTNGTESL